MLPDVRRCVDCASPFPPSPAPGYTGGTGYGTRTVTDYTGPAGDFCYPCAERMDRRVMAREGRIVLYQGSDAAGLTLVNWPGSLVVRVSVRKINGSRGSGGFGGARRTDYWFTGPDGAKWHGVQRGGSNTLVRCKRLKSK